MKFNPVVFGGGCVLVSVYLLCHLYGVIKLPENRRDKQSYDSSHLVV